MHVQPINYFCTNGNIGLNTKKTKSVNSNPSFGWIEGLGKRVLNAGNSELRSYAERYRTVPTAGLPDLLEVTNMFGFKSSDKTRLAVERFQSAVKDVTFEIAELTRCGSKEAKARLKKLDEKAEAGLREYYHDDPVDNYDDGDYRGDKFYY